MIELASETIDPPHPEASSVTCKWLKSLSRASSICFTIFLDFAHFLQGRFLYQRTSNFSALVDFVAPQTMLNIASKSSTSSKPDLSGSWSVILVVSVLRSHWRRDKRKPPLNCVPSLYINFNSINTKSPYRIRAS